MPEQTGPDEQRRSALRWLYHVLWHHPAVALSAFYVLFCVSGALSTHYTFRPFGINALDYSDAIHLLLVGLRQPLLLLGSLAVLAILYASMQVGYSAAPPSRVRQVFEWGTVLLVTGTFLFFVHFAASLYDLKDRLSSPHKIALVTMHSNPSAQAPLVVLATTHRFLLAAEPRKPAVLGSAWSRPRAADYTIRAIPVSSIRDITFQRSGQRRVFTPP